MSLVAIKHRSKVVIVYPDGTHGESQWIRDEVADTLIASLKRRPARFERVYRVRCRPRRRSAAP